MRWTVLGGNFLEEATFEGITIPTRIRAGWHFGTKRLENDGELFRAAITSVQFV